MVIKILNVPVRGFCEATIEIPDPPKSVRSKAARKAFLNNAIREALASDGAADSQIRRSRNVEELELDPGQVDAWEFLVEEVSS